MFHPTRVVCANQHPLLTTARSGSKKNMHCAQREHVRDTSQKKLPRARYVHVRENVRDTFTCTTTTKKGARYVTEEALHGRGRTIVAATNRPAPTATPTTGAHPTLRAPNHHEPHGHMTQPPLRQAIHEAPPSSTRDSTSHAAPSAKSANTNHLAMPSRISQHLITPYDFRPPTL